MRGIYLHNAFIYAVSLLWGWTLITLVIARRFKSTFMKIKKHPSPILTEEIQSWLFVQCYVPIDRGIQFALRKMIACKNWSQRRISAKLKSHLKFPHIHFVRIRKNVNIYFFVSTLNKEINIYACIYAYKWMCTWLEALIFLFI
jgi:hypothetical protein